MSRRTKSMRAREDVVFSVPKMPSIASSLLESVEDGGVSLLGVEAVVEEEGVALGPPGVGVLDTPDGDTNAVLLVKAGLGDVGPVSLLGVLDVDLGHGALGSNAAEELHGVDGSGTLAGGKVSLRTDTVDGDTGGDPLLDVLGKGLGLCVVGSVKVVVVDVTLGRWVSLLGSLESDADKVLTEDVVEDAGTEAAVLLEHLVDDVPGVDLTLEVTHDGGDVVLHDSGQGGLVPDGRDPTGKLGVPDGGVSTDELAIVLGELSSLVGGAEGEFAAGRLGSIPLHGVLRGDLTKVGLDDGSVLALVESAWVSGGTEVLPALGLHGGIEALRSLALLKESLWLSKGRGSDQSAGRKDGDERKLHSC